VRRWVRYALFALQLAWATPACAAGIIDRIHAQGTLRCGAVGRPGIAEISSEGGARGVAVDLCRAVATAVLGPSARVAFGLYEAPQSFDGVRRGGDAIAFLTGGEIAEQGLAGFMVPGPTVLIDMIGFMVPQASPVQRVADLTGHTVCLMIGSRAQRALESAVEAQHLSIARLPFEEDVEMLDAYKVGSCGAAAGEVTYLADMRRNPGVRRTNSRLLPELLAPDPIVAVTPRSDGAWAAAVAWVIGALLSADSPADAWSSNASPALHIAGLRSGWRDDAIAAVGSYSAIVRRNLTDGLGLAPGPNAVWPAGMLLAPAVR
jgi:general L-amino acid transport system substrate-binding protein